MACKRHRRSRLGSRGSGRACCIQCLEHRERTEALANVQSRDAGRCQPEVAAPPVGGGGLSPQKDAFLGGKDDLRQSKGVEAEERGVLASPCLRQEGTVTP
jgi:hypothetical protein